MTQISQSTDILISGGGIAGLTAAAAFGTAGFSVTCVDPVPPLDPKGAGAGDLRTTAFLQPSRDVLAAAGLWDRLGPHAAPLQIMRIVDAGGADGTPRETADFDAGDLGDLPFAWNLPNRVLRREMVARLDELPNVDFRPGRATAGVTTRLDHALVRLEDGTNMRARLVIAADGRNSPVRTGAGINVKTWRYGQKALVFTVSHSTPTQGTSTEIHRTGGPFTLVPLPDRDGKPHSAVVWMETGPKALDLAAMSGVDLEQAATERSCGLWGPLTLTSPVQVWPMISQLADRLTAQRIALIAEAAHVVPPIGAQGLNMSLADLSCLLDLAIKTPDDPGAPALLDRYERARHPIIAARVFGIDKLNRASMAGTPILRDLRRQGLKLIHDVAPLRHRLMRAGLGPGI